MFLRYVKFFKKADFIILFFFLGITLASFLFLKTSGKRESTLVIQAGKDEYIYSLKKNREIQVKGILGTSTIVIQDGKAYFKNSPCKNHLCVNMGAVEAENDWAACLPNDIFIRVE